MAVELRKCPAGALSESRSKNNGYRASRLSPSSTLIRLLFPAVSTTFRIFGGGTPLTLAKVSSAFENTLKAENGEPVGFKRCDAFDGTVSRPHISPSGLALEWTYHRPASSCSAMAGETLKVVTLKPTV